MTHPSNLFWAEDLSVLKENMTRFFPSPYLTTAENLNALTRLSIYMSVLLILFTGKAYYLWGIILTFLLTYLAYRFYGNKQELYQNIDQNCDSKLLCSKEEVDNTQVCTRPTNDNPFMNFNYITDTYYREPACKAFIEDTPDAQEIKEEVKDSFNHNLYRDVSDLYSKRNSQRQFFTMPWTSWPNDQTSFAKWLYRTGPTCKELGIKCAPFWTPSSTYSKLEE